MSESSTEQSEQGGQGQQQAQQQSQEQAAQTEQQDVASLPQWARDAISKANNEAAKYRTQVRELEPKAQQFTQLEEASKSEQQRMQESLEAANRGRDAAQSDALKFRIAAEEGVARDDLDLLGNGDEDTLRTRAQRVAEMRAAVRAAEDAADASNQQRSQQQRPAEQLRPGATPSNETTSDDDRLYEQIYGAPKQ